LAILFDEPGSDRVEPYLGSGGLSVVNYSEIVARLSDYGVAADAIDGQIDRMSLTLLEFDRSVARAAGLLRSLTRDHGLSFADRACLATALALGRSVVTADRMWARLNLGLTVEIIR
jgi:PIN domain nuclease of toxin-antitoxin system